MTAQAGISTVASPYVSRSLSRGDLGLFLLAGFAIAEQDPMSVSTTLEHVLQALAQQNLFVVFALLVAGRNFLMSGVELRPGRADWLIAAIGTVLFAIVCFTGVYQLAGAALTLLLIPLWFAGPRNTAFTSALMVSGALAVNSFWGPVLFQTFTSEIISFDTTLLHAAYSILRPDIQQHGVTFSVPSGFGIVVVGYCSVFNSASVAFLAATAATQYMKPGVRGRDALVLAAALLAMIAINTGRLILMGWGRSEFEFWHNGGGGPYIALGQTIIIAIIAITGARWSTRTRS